MKHYIDLLSILTPIHLRNGYENRSRFNCGDFEINIFETFQSSTKIQIQYDGLSISSMIRGAKVLHTHDGNLVNFEPGTSLILPEGEKIFADLPNAQENNPVQCATILIPSIKLKQHLETLDTWYPRADGKWNFDFSNFHFNNNSDLARAFNEILQLTAVKQQNLTLNDLLLKAFLVRIINAQEEHASETAFFKLNNQLYNVKRYINDHLTESISIEDLTSIGNCSKRSLYRFFELYCNRTPGEYILHERIALARNLLLNPLNNISKVAYMSGFSSISYFTKQFKLLNNCTPGEFIKRFRIDLK